MTACTHPCTIEGGNRPAGRWCSVCGQKVERKPAPTPVARVDRTISKEAARIQALKIELARQSTLGKISE